MSEDEWVEVARSDSNRAHAVARWETRRLADEFGVIAQRVAVTRCRKRLVEPRAARPVFPRCSLCQARPQGFSELVIAHYAQPGESQVSVQDLARKLKVTGPVLVAELAALVHEGRLVHEGTGRWRVA